MDFQPIEQVKTANNEILQKKQSSYDQQRKHGNTLNFYANLMQHDWYGKKKGRVRQRGWNR